ncbi:hypothetical protein BGZ58_010674 [Dissophora ornata]|nr:hypothetical protein BGZ58_010674 [Dissophora ornata]
MSVKRMTGHLQPRVPPLAAPSQALETETLKNASEILKAATTLPSPSMKKQACKDVGVALQNIIKRNKKSLDPSSTPAHRTLSNTVADLYDDQAALWKSIGRDSDAKESTKLALRWRYDPNDATDSESSKATKGGFFDKFRHHRSPSPLPPSTERQSFASSSFPTFVTLISSFCGIDSLPFQPPSPEIDRVMDRVFKVNIARPVAEIHLPHPGDSLKSTLQLASCAALIALTKPSSQFREEFENSLSIAQQQWVHITSGLPREQKRINNMTAAVVVEFMNDRLKDPAVIAEIVSLAPVLESTLFQKLLNWFIAEIKREPLLKDDLVDGLANLIQAAPPESLVVDDLVIILSALSSRLQNTDVRTPEYVYGLTTAVSSVLDAMAFTNVDGLSRERLHDPLFQYLKNLSSSSDLYLQHLAQCAFQALLCIPNDESTLNSILRRTGTILKAASGLVSAVKSFDLGGLLDGLSDLQDGLVAVYHVVDDNYEGIKSLWDRGNNFYQSVNKNGIHVDRRRPWYSALRGADELIHEGRLSDLKKLMYEGACRHGKEFQFGICLRLVRIALENTWDDQTRKDAIDILAEIYRNDADWGNHENVKRWIVTLLVQLSSMSNGSVGGHCSTVMSELGSCGDDKKKKLFMETVVGPRSTCVLTIKEPTLPSSLLLEKVQNLPDVESEIERIKCLCFHQQSQSLYIPIQAKPSIQSPDDDRFSLMDHAKEFLDNDREVLLILGDSGGGKSTFNKEIEQYLWGTYKEGGRVPLFISLPTIKEPEDNMVKKHLQTLDVTKDDMVTALKRTRTFILICDGYDEIKECGNLFHKNLFNQHGQWKVKMIISCRSMYVGKNYQMRFQPLDDGQRTGSKLFQEAVIAPFSKPQIAGYIQLYVNHFQSPWTAAQYLQALDKDPKLYELVENPFLLKATLDVLTPIDGVEKDISSEKLTRVRIYDLFINHWLENGEKRSYRKTLTPEAVHILNELSEEVFSQRVLEFMKTLATAIYKKQGGKPIVRYQSSSSKTSSGKSKDSWKTDFFGSGDGRQLLRDASPILRSGNNYSFIHTSVLEYLFSCAIFDPRDSESEDDTDDDDAKDSSALPVEGLLRLQSLVNEESTSILDFLSERVQRYPVFKQQLWVIVIKSKTIAKDDSGGRIEAANAITILVRAGVHFNSADLRGIQVPRADLTSGQFDSTQFQEADLTGANLTRSWIRQADFTNAQMADVQFGELPYLKETGMVHSCAYSPDGQTFAVGLWRKIRLYETETWKKVRLLRGHTGAIESVSFSHTGNQIVSCCGRAVRIWDLQKGSCITLKGRLFPHGVTCVAISRNELQIALAMASVTSVDAVLIWNVEAGGTFVLRDHANKVTSLAWSPSGHQIASGSGDGTIRLWNSKTRISSLVLGSVASPASRVCCIAYSPDGRRIVAGHNNGELKLWDSMTGKLERVLSGHSKRVAVVTFSPMGQWIASGSDDKSVRLWDPEAHVAVSILNGHTCSVYGVVFSPDSLHIVSCSSDQTVRRWVVNTRGASLDSQVDPGEVSSVAYSSNGQHILSGSSNGRLRKWEALTGVSSPLKLDLPFDIIFVAFSPSSRQIATKSRGRQFAASIWSDGRIDDNVTLRNSQTGVAEDVLCGHTHDVLSLAYSPCSRWIASGGSDKTVRLWDLHDASQGRTLEGHTDKVNTVAFSPDGPQIASGGDDGTIRLWHSGTGDCTAVLEGHTDEVTSVTYSPDDLQIVSCSHDGTLRLWHAPSGEPGPVLHTHAEKVWSAAFSPCCKWIAATFTTICSIDDDDDDYYETLRLWKVDELENWSCKIVPRDLFDCVSSVAWNPLDSMEFVTGSWDQSVRVWRLAEEQDDVSLSVSLLWSVHPSRLNATNAKIKDAVGLSKVNRELLSQHGATGETLIYESDESDSDSESDESDSDSESDESDSDSESDESDSDSESVCRRAYWRETSRTEETQRKRRNREWRRKL